MSAEGGERDYPLETELPGRGAAVPAWYLRLRLRWASASIVRIEQQLAGEFGLAETAPLYRELEALVAERDALAKRLAARS